MKGFVTLTLLIATFLGGYHLGKQGAFGDFTSQAPQFVQDVYQHLKTFSDDLKKETASAKPSTPAPQPARIAARDERPQPADSGIVLHINGKRYVLGESRPR